VREALQNIQPLLRTDNLVKRYRVSRGAQSHGGLAALDGVTLAILPGTTLALVGESGSGKSTLALCLACLERPSSGEIWLRGEALTHLSESELRRVRPRVQMIFQDATSAMNPRLNALEIVSEPLLIANRMSRTERLRRSAELFEKVELSPDWLQRRIGEFSGGQRQRLAIARALAAEPEVLILDESLSGLDCSVQAQIANLLLELQAATGLTCLFITHDIAMAVHLGDQIAVMDRGRIVESGAVNDVVRYPRHDRTRALLQASPRLAEPELELSRR
jgi:ABC-type glutathione transport system ATPase component